MVTPLTWRTTKQVIRTIPPIHERLAIIAALAQAMIDKTAATVREQVQSRVGLFPDLRSELVRVITSLCTTVSQLKFNYKSAVVVEGKWVELSQNAADRKELKR